MAVRCVRLSPREAYDKICVGLTGQFLTAEEIASHTVRNADKSETVVGVFEKYSWRNSNRMTMTVLCSPAGKGKSEVFFVASGASGGLLGFDWGAGEDFEHALESSLGEYLCTDPDDL